MTQAQCLMTGCDFLDVEGKRWIHGDLHQIFDIMIFNGTGCDWYDCIDTPMDPKAKIMKCEHFYEKNNVIVFPLAYTQFNDVANEYLNKLIKGEESQIITFGKH